MRPVADGPCGGVITLNGHRAFPVSMVEIDELFGGDDVADDVELADQLVLRGLERNLGSRVAFAFGSVLRPLTFASEIVPRFRVFDDDVHRRLPRKEHSVAGSNVPAPTKRRINLILDNFMRKSHPFLLPPQWGEHPIEKLQPKP